MSGPRESLGPLCWRLRFSLCEPGGHRAAWGRERWPWALGFSAPPQALMHSPPPPSMHWARPCFQKRGRAWVWGPGLPQSGPTPLQVRVPLGAWAPPELGAPAGWTPPRCLFSPRPNLGWSLAARPNPSPWGAPGPLEEDLHLPARGHLPRPLLTPPTGSRAACGPSAFQGGRRDSRSQLRHLLSWPHLVSAAPELNSDIHQCFTAAFLASPSQGAPGPKDGALGRQPGRPGAWVLRALAWAGSFSEPCTCSHRRGAARVPPGSDLHPIST